MTRRTPAKALECSCMSRAFRSRMKNAVIWLISPAIIAAAFLIWDATESCDDPIRIPAWR